MWRAIDCLRSCSVTRLWDPPCSSFSVQQLANMTCVCACVHRMPQWDTDFLMTREFSRKTAHTHGRRQADHVLERQDICDQMNRMGLGGSRSNPSRSAHEIRELTCSDDNFASRGPKGNSRKGQANKFARNLPDNATQGSVGPAYKQGPKAKNDDGGRQTYCHINTVQGYR